MTTPPGCGRRSQTQPDKTIALTCGKPTQCDTVRTKPECMIRRRSTVRFRNGTQIGGLIRKDSNEPWMPVGTNGCHQGSESPATASPRPYPQGIWRYLEHPVRSRIRSQPAGQGAGEATTGTGAVRSRDYLDAQVTNTSGKSFGSPRRDGQARSAPACAVIMSAGRAGPRIASARIPASPAGPGRRPRRARWRRGYPPRAASGQCPAPVRSCGPDDVLSVRAGLARRLAAIYVTSALAATGMRRSRRAVPSRAASARVILRVWKRDTDPGNRLSLPAPPALCRHPRYSGAG